MPEPHGGTLADAFAAYRRETGLAHPDDKGHPVPLQPEFAYLFRWFMELAHGRPVGGMGVMLPIPSAEILAWSQLHRVQLQDWEIGALRALDAAWLQSIPKDP